MSQSVFGRMPDGQEVTCYTLTHESGIRAGIIPWGGAIVSLEVPDKAGNMGDVVLGFDRLADYLQPHPAIGTLIGRYGNRIAYGKFELEGNSYQLATNLPPHHLHGKSPGFDEVLWEVKAASETQLVLSYLSKDGEAGYPGNLEVEVTYTLTAERGIRIRYEAMTDQPTIVNLTNHSYFNLAGQGNILDHELQVKAAHILDVDADLVPTGNLRRVLGTPFDFQEWRRVGDRIDEPHPILEFGKGYDHNFVIDAWDESMRLGASLKDPRSGRQMEVWTDQPGIQIYTANHLNDLTGKEGIAYAPHMAICLETQHFPDSPNHPSFPSTVLKPGETYQTETEYRFS
ncbi:MAG: aldose epimerase family protein [Bacteroidota bacterium]